MDFNYSQLPFQSASLILAPIQCLPLPNNPLPPPDFSICSASSVLPRSQFQLTNDILNFFLPFKRPPSPQSTPTNESVSKPTKTGICCNCSKSRCVKLYCECFALGTYCEGCSCRNCKNKPRYEQRRKRIIDSITEKNPEAFSPKFSKEEGNGTVHSRGCRCRKSRCSQRYCECFQSGIKCTAKCICTDCVN